MFEIWLSDDGTIFVKGRLDAAQAGKAKAFLDSVTESCNIDMGQLDYISSAGLGLLLATFKRLKDDGKELALRNLNQHIFRIFHISGLDKVFNIEQGA